MEIGYFKGGTDIGALIASAIETQHACFWYTDSVASESAPRRYILHRKPRPRLRLTTTDPEGTSAASAAVAAVSTPTLSDTTASLALVVEVSCHNRS